MANKTYAGLLKEIELVSTKRKIAELKIKEQAKILSGELQPANLVKSAISGLASDTGVRKDLFSKGMKAGAGFLVSRVLFGKSHFILRLAGTALASTLASKVTEKNINEYIPKIRQLISRFRKRKDDLPGN